MAAGCAAALTVAGCYESHPSVNVTERDAVLRDGAIGLDAAQALEDAAIASDAAIAGDAGADGGVLACDQPIGPYGGPGCAPATRNCITACTEAACVNDCVARDSECVRCIDQMLVSCTNDLGCEEQWLDFACCAQSQPGCETRSGVELFACADACPEIDAYDACTMSIDATSCVSDISAHCSL